jgi:hypothetical protein
MSGDDSTFRGRFHRLSVIGTLDLDHMAASNTEITDAGVANRGVAPMPILTNTDGWVRAPAHGALRGQRQVAITPNLGYEPAGPRPPFSTLYTPGSTIQRFCGMGETLS